VCWERGEGRREGRRERGVEKGERLCCEVRTPCLLRRPCSSSSRRREEERVEKQVVSPSS
jgi:hypothetical protein